jgi:hypothetical protein
MNEKSYLAIMDRVANPSLLFVIYTTFTNSERENYRKYQVTTSPTKKAVLVSRKNNDHRKAVVARP